MKEKALISIAIGLPMVFIVGLLIANSISFGPKPQYNFVYTYQAGENWYGENLIGIEGGKVTVKNVGQNGLSSERCFTYEYDYAKPLGKEQARTRKDSYECNEKDPQKLLEYYYKNNVRFYLYDVTDEKEQELTLEEVKALILQDTKLSRDRFSFSNERSGNGLMQEIFVGGGRNQYYLVKDDHYVRLNISSKGDRYNYNSGYYQFLGWVE